MFFTSKSTAHARKTRLSIRSLVSPCGFGCHFILASENELQTLSDTSHEKYSQINVHVHIKNILAFATTNNLRSLFLGENCAGFLKGARGYLGRGKASQSSIPSKVMSGGSRFAGSIFQGLKKKRFQRSCADSLACELALCCLEFRITAQPPTISSAAAYGKND